MKRIAILLAFVGLAFVPQARAQNHAEAAAFGDYYRPSQLNDRSMWGLGGRFSLNVHPKVQLEAEVAYDFQQSFNESFTDPITGNVTLTRSPIRVLHGLFGPKLQTGGGALRAFLTLKGGIVNFRFDNRPATFATFSSSVESLRANNVNGALYPGGGAEAFFGPFGIRLDVGDEIYFRNGARNNLRIAIGPTIRF